MKHFGTEPLYKNIAEPANVPYSSKLAQLLGRAAFTYSGFHGEASDTPAFLNITAAIFSGR
jgi:hypothetical protein